MLLLRFHLFLSGALDRYQRKTAIPSTSPKSLYSALSMLENHDSAEYGTLIACLEELRDHPPVDNSFRKTCYARLREAMLSVEEPIDTIRRLCFAVSFAALHYHH